MSRVPTAVRQKAQSVDDMIRANAAASSADDPAFVPDAPTDDVPASTADIVPIDKVTSAIPTGDADTVTTGMQDVALQQLDATAQEVEEYKQRWKSLDGQLRQRDTQLAQQAEQIARLTDLVSNMAEGQARTSAEPQAPVGVTASDADDFGEDMVAFVSRVATAVVQQAMSGVQSKVDNLEHGLGDVTRSTAGIVKKSFQEQLKELAPRYTEFDTDQEFHNWLAMSQSRHDSFYASVGIRDAAGVADYFNLYASTLPPPKANPAAAAQAQLERQVAPRKSGTGATVEQGQSEPKTWTRTEIARNYKARQNRKISDADWAPLEKEMTAAQNEGRVDFDR